MGKFHLPVLGTAGRPATADELVVRALHGEAIYDGALGDVVNLDIGTGIVSAEFPEVDMANEVRDVQLPRDGGIEDAISEALRAFASRGVKPLAWTFAGGVAVEPIAKALEAQRYRRHSAEVWALREPRNCRQRADLSVIPARASFGGIRALLHAVGNSMPGEPASRIDQYAEAGVRALDDPRVDGVLAMSGATAVGMAYLVTAGESGFLADLYVHPDHRGTGVGTTLVERIIELGTRSRHRSLTLFCRKDNSAATRLYEKTGWAKVGVVHSMRAVVPE